MFTMRRPHPTRRPRLVFATAVAAAITGTLSPAIAQDLPPFAEVSKEYTQVNSTADGQQSLYGLWYDAKKEQLLAELPRGWANQKHLIAITQASGGIFAGLQGPMLYVYWKRYGNRIALIAPEIGTRATGEREAQSSVDRLFTDRVLLDVPIVSTGPNGQPVIDLDDLLVRQLPGVVRLGATNRPQLARVASAKAFPQNLEIQIETPGNDGRLVAVHYSISLVPNNTGYKPREADERVGYFTTVYRDLGSYDPEAKWKRYINRWHLEKRDPSLRMSPPKQPIVFYIEHTVPVRYRRWVRDGVLIWNNAFEQIGLVGAIEVHQQDKDTGQHMEKDPEDVRYNFIRWLNNDISTAIGPSRPHPLTGQILDADVILTDGWIRAYWSWFHEDAPELGVESFTPETVAWLEKNPQWDPRLLLASPAERDRIVQTREDRRRRIERGEEVEPLSDHPAMRYNEALHAISNVSGCRDRCCMAAHGLASNMAFAAMNLDALGLLDIDLSIDPRTMKESDMLDGIPEWFVGPMLLELTAHDVGHTLGLRHNFKASSIYTMAEINSEEMRGKKAFAGSVMDYLPPNFNFGAGEVQGDFTMIDIGPYDYWAIEYGYTLGDTKKVLERVNEPELVYQTDDDLGGPDPLARQYDFSANPIEYAQNQMRLVEKHRANVLERFVKEGQSWSRARQGYERTLSMQIRMLSMMSNWVGGAEVFRNRKGDPDGRPPLEVVDPERQREAIQFIIEHAMRDESFGLTPELMLHMTVDKWSDDSPGDRGDPAWPVHDRIMGVQASSLTMLVNPTTLRRVFDNELRTPADQDALTMPEMMGMLMDEIFSELDGAADGSWSNRQPAISSLRRNLQSTMVERLIALADGSWNLPRPIATLALRHLRVLDQQLVDLVGKDADASNLDDYTVAHLEDLHNQIDMALNRMYVTAR